MKLENQTFDAIIVGSGPGGSTVARELSRAGKTVLMLEKGKDPAVKGSLLQMMPTIRSIPTTGKTPIITQSVVGGATFSFCGAALEPPYDIFDAHGIDLREYAAETKEELGIEPLPDRLIGPMTKRVMESALDLGIDWQKIPKFIDASKCRPGCWKCTYNCPYGAKWTARAFAVEALENGGELAVETKVDRIIIENGKATGVAFRKKDETVRVEAPLVILSAGGMYSPKILEKSGVDGVGRDFFFDPLLLVTGVVKGTKGGLREIPMSTGINYSKEGYLLTDLTFTGLRYMSSALSAGEFSKLFSGKSALSIMVKIRDELSGRLTEKGPVLKELGEVEKKRFKEGTETAEQILKNAGATSTFTSSISGAHPGGTIKIGEFVDRNLKTQVDNLYVCDASVIPTAWGLPPVLTLISLGKRLARHLTSS
ncbi:MAG: GMC family oxidoreductase [Desulfobacterales bacterium]